MKTFILIILGPILLLTGIIVVISIPERAHQITQSKTNIAIVQPQLDFVGIDNAVLLEDDDLDCITDMDCCAKFPEVDPEFCFGLENTI